MDFFAKPMDDIVVNSPSNGAPCLPKSYSPSPLQPRDLSTLQMLPSVLERVPLRKLYKDIGLPMSMTMMTSLILQEPIIEKICPGSHGPLLLRPCVRTLGVRMRKSHDGVPPTWCTSIQLSVLDRKFIQLQRL